MTERERILAVYRGVIPDRVPFFLDLSHWFNERHKIPFDLSTPATQPDGALIDCHRKIGAGFYLANLASSYDIVFPHEVASSAVKENSARGTEIVWRIRRRWGRSNVGASGKSRAIPGAFPNGESARNRTCAPSNTP